MNREIGKRIVEIYMHKCTILSSCYTALAMCTSSERFVYGLDFVTYRLTPAFRWYEIATDNLDDTIHEREKKKGNASARTQRSRYSKSRGWQVEVLTAVCQPAATQRYRMREVSLTGYIIVCCIERRLLKAPDNQLIFKSCFTCLSITHIRINIAWNYYAECM